MNTDDRIHRIRQVEKAMGKLRKKGWRIESVRHEDEEDEPFRSTIRVSVEGESGHTGVL